MTPDLKFQVRQRAIAEAIRQADARMVIAKTRFTTAAVACQRGAPDADKQVKGALDAVDAARSALREANDVVLT